MFLGLALQIEPKVVKIEGIREKPDVKRLIVLFFVSQPKINQTSTILF